MSEQPSKTRQGGAEHADRAEDDPRVLPVGIKLEIALLSEPALQDWNRPEEEASWAYLQAEVV